MTDEAASIPKDPDMWMSSWSSFSSSQYRTDQKDLSTKPQSHEKKNNKKIFVVLIWAQKSEEMGVNGAGTYLHCGISWQG